MKIGFSGTRDGMTDVQYDRVSALVGVLARSKNVEAHHGACIGSDAQFHQICLQCGVGVKIVLHPAKLVGQMKIYRAKCLGATEIRRMMPPLERNRAIVGEVEVMIFTPKGMKPVVRGSGTWATWRYAVAARKIIHLILPDGTIREERLR